jgi:hypothetical protein
MGAEARFEDFDPVMQNIVATLQAHGMDVVDIRPGLTGSEVLIGQEQTFYNGGAEFRRFFAMMTFSHEADWEPGAWVLVLRRAFPQRELYELSQDAVAKESFIDEILRRISNIGDRLEGYGIDRFFTFDALMIYDALKSYTDDETLLPRDNWDAMLRRAAGWAAVEKLSFDLRREFCLRLETTREVEHALSTGAPVSVLLELYNVTFFSVQPL